MKVVLDPNVLVAALLSSGGSPAELIRRWKHGRFDVVVSPALLGELGRVLGYPKLRRRIDEELASAVIEDLRRHALLVDDPSEPSPLRASDPDDDHLLALASRTGAAIVSGDKHLLVLADQAPIFSPAGFVAHLDASD